MFSGSRHKSSPSMEGGANAAARRRLLTVEIIEARNLMASSKSGKSDPVATVSLTDLGGREIKKEGFSTKAKKDTLAPVWNETFVFGNTYDLDTAADDLPNIQVSVFSKPLMAVSEILLGVASVHLDKVNPSGGTTDLWVPLEPSGRVTQVSGEVHLKLTFNQPPSQPTQSSLMTAVDEETGNADEDTALLMEGAEGQTPNELHIYVLQARRLIAADRSMFGGAGSSDPQVRLQIEGQPKKTTKFIRKTLAPQWNEEIVFDVDDPSLSVKVTVEDHNDITPTATFLGRITLELQNFDDQKPRQAWYKLMNKTLEADGVDRGEIELRVHWKFNVKVKEAMLKKREKESKSVFNQFSRGMSTVGKTLGVVEKEDDEAEAEDNEKEMEEVERPQTEEEKEAAKAKEEEKKKELSDIEIKDGDYQVQVHIIEARDLKAENLDGTSDPIVYVECFGQKRNTQVIKGVTSCVFDEVFIFNMKNLDKETFETGLIRISCYDSGVFGAMNTMIGAYAFDASMVYTNNKDHELYRQWVALMDDEDADDVGVQGYLKITVAIIGPGEKMKVHDEDKERADEIAKEAAAGGDIGTMVLAPPTIVKEWKYIVVDLYKAEGLPIMDGAIGIGVMKAKKAGTDAFVKLSFAGGKPLKSPVVTKQGDSRKMINPIWNAQLWYPVSVPTMTQVIKLTVLDKDDVTDEVIGHIIAKFNALKAAPQQTLATQWYNVYGAPEFKQGKLLDNLEKGAKAISKKAKQTLGAEIDWSEYYNNTPDKASSFKGRLLMRIRLMDKPPPKKAKELNGEVKPFRLKLPKGLTKAEEPLTQKYILQALVITGSDVPKLGLLGDQMRVRVSIGIDEISTKPVKNEGGLCRWNEFLRSEPLDYPVDVTQLPDIFVYLLNNDLKPVCYARIKTVLDPKKKTILNFDAKTDWVLLQEDKSIDALNTNVFPGQILMKVGFGLQADADMVRPEWNNILESARKGRAHQVRVHLYQARNIPAADSNGLCDPYLKIKFMDQEKTSAKKKKTLFPTYYQTKVFDDILIPEFDNYSLAPPVTFRLFDTDLDGDDYLGTCNFYLKDAQVTLDPNTPLKDPVWKSLFYEVPNDSQGEVLVSVQLIPTDGRKLAVKEDDIDIKPPTRDAFVEFVVIGIRDMAPYNFQEMQNPFIEIELNSFGSAYKSSTAPSKRPSPSDPNFLEKIQLPVKLPLKSIYCSPLSILARDTRLGGYLKPVVGVCQIDLSTKLPWDLESYIPPCTDLFAKNLADLSEPAAADDAMALLPGQNADAISMKTKELESQREGDIADDDYIALQEPAKLNAYIKDRVALDDTGAGVFGALSHINTDGTSRKKANAADAFTDPDLVPDEGEQPPEWSINRAKLDSELESELKTTPFETYSLMRGKVNGFLGSTLKVVGRLKGLVRVIESKDTPPLLPQDLMDQLMKPSTYCIRLYALRGIRLEALDTDIFGKPSNSDPYLKVVLGKKVFNDRENAVDDVSEVDFYKMVTFETQLPGISQLKVQVYDKDLIGSDDLIGATVIDLEDRWFDARWQAWGEEYMIKPGQDPKDPSKVRFAPKPIERRGLYAPGVHMERGKLECWVDILTNSQNSTFPPDDISLPPKQIFEVRVVIWKTKNVPPQDTFEGMSDLFVKCWPEGCDPLETDTHWRCKKGKASFNWRMLFDVELGHNSRAMKFPYFHLQLWDRDILKWNDCAGEGMINLGPYYRKAYKRNIAIKLYEKKKGLAAKRAKMRKQQKRSDFALIDTTDDIPPEEDELEGFGLIGDDTSSVGGGGSIKSPLTTAGSPSQAMLSANATEEEPKYAAGTSLLPQRQDRDSDDDDDDNNLRADTGMGAIPSNLPSRYGKEHKMLLKKPTKRHQKKRKLLVAATSAGATPVQGAAPSLWQRLQFWKKAEEPKKEELGEDGKPLLKNEGDEEAPAEKTEEEKKNDENDEARELITTFKNMTGLWDIDPEDSAWYHLEQRDKNDPSKVTPMGSICYSIQIWPKDKATVMAVGSARSEPNTNPFLPPPVGRLKFSLNPFVMGSELCGPALCAQFFCCLLCAAFIVLMIFCQPFLNIIINLIFVVY